MTNNVEHFFMSMGHLYVLLGEVSIWVLCPFFNWVVCLPGVQSYEFLINSGCQTLARGIVGENVFPYGWVPFHFVDFFLAIQKLLNLMEC